MSEKKQLKKEWDKVAVRQLKDSFTPERIAQDEADLQEVFALAEKSPMLKQALDWAQAHDVDFIVDRKMLSMAGYYMFGTGTVTMCLPHLSLLARLSASNLATPLKVDEDDLRKQFYEEMVVEFVTHEIRHMWQDWNGMTQTEITSFEDYFITLSMIEADAQAHGDYAKREYINSIKPAIELPDVNQSLWDEFQCWFWQLAPTYGALSANSLSVKLQIEELPIKILEKEFNPYADKPTPALPGLNKADMKAVFALGQKFDGTTYFPDDAEDFLKGTVLVPANASTFYDTANISQKKQVKAINAAIGSKKIVM